MCIDNMFVVIFLVIDYIMIFDVWIFCMFNKVVKIDIRGYF